MQTINKKNMDEWRRYNIENHCISFRQGKYILTRAASLHLGQLMKINDESARKAKAR
jgi:hypothetical protein